MEKLILASGSPRRREILESVGAEFELLMPDVDENVPPLSPEQTVMTLAERKCRAALELLPPGSEVRRSAPRRCCADCPARTIPSIPE